METLYDLLGALPNDDAEGLRAAFRRAVKGAHPDIRPGDPEAALKFREIVRANEILGDAEQRAAYDELLELARLERDQAAKRAVAARIHKLASGVIALSGASVVTVGGYLLFMHMSAASVAPPNSLDLTRRASPEIAAAASDLTGSIIGPDPAQQLDPKFLPGYADRGIIFYGLHPSDRAFANIAPAKPVERPSHRKPAPAMARKPRFDPAPPIPPWG